MTCHYCKSFAKKFGKFGVQKIQRYRCTQCGKTFHNPGPLDEMRTPVDKAVQIINLLVEGVGINATARIAGVNKRTVLSLLVVAGQRCEKLMNSTMRNIHVADIQCDEIWSFVKCKDKHVKPTDDRERVGDQYTYVAMDPTTKLVISFFIGKRNVPSTQAFMNDLSKRISSHVQINTDAFGAYQHAIRRAFGFQADHGQITKIYAGGPDPGRSRYSPPAVIGAIRTVISGMPDVDKICTSKTTPAVAAGVTDHVWTLEELLRAA